MEKVIDTRSGYDATVILHDCIYKIVSSKFGLSDQEAHAGNALLDAILYLKGCKITPDVFTSKLFDESVTIDGYGYSITTNVKE